MAERRPLVIAGNNVSELPSGDKVSASLIANTPAGNIAATDVQAAINELDTEKLPNTTSLTEIGAALDDNDEIPVYDLSATVNRKSLLSRLWTYISGKLASPPAIGGTTPAAGNFTTLGATGNVTLGDASGDTVTINGTGVSIPNNLNFDSSTLFIDAANNRVGIGTNTPSAALDVSTSVTAGTNAFIFKSGTIELLSGYRATYGNIRALTVGLGGTIDNANSTGVCTFSTNTIALGNGYYTPRANRTTTLYQMFDGVHSWQTAAASAQVGIVNATTIVTGQRYTIVTAGTTDYTTVGSANNTAGTSFVATGTPTGDGTVYWNQTFVPRMTLGTTGTWTLLQSSGSGNTSVSFNTTVQNAMTLDSSGNLLVGTTTAKGTTTISSANVTPSSAGNGQLVLTVPETTVGSGGQIQFGGFYTGTNYSSYGAIKGAKEGGTNAGYLAFYSEPNTGDLTERLRITSAGTLLLRQSSDAANTSVSFNTTIQDALTLSSAGSLGIGTTSFGTSAATVLGIKTGTAPTTGPADTIQLYSTDLSAGNTMLSLYTEGTCVNANATAAATHRIAVRINGTVYYLLANTAA